MLPHAGLDVGPGIGVVSVTPDVDGVLRRVAPLHTALGRVLPSLALALLFGPAERPSLRIEDGALVAGTRRWPLDGAGRVLRASRATGTSCACTHNLSA